MSDQSLPNWLHMFFSLPPDVQDTEWRHAPIYKTTCLLDCYKIPTAASAILTMAQIKAKSKKKTKKTLLLFIQQFQFSLLLLPILFFVTVSSVSSLFNSSLFLGVSLSSFSSLPPQSISLQWPGRLTAAPPEEYQSMLLWRPNQAPLVYFLPLFSFPSSWPCMLLFMV